MGKQYNAAMIVIGNEILSGRTQDKNINYVATKLSKHGIVLSEVRVIPDIEDVIVQTIHDLQERVDYIFTSGGIGPTHDDITAQSVAKAFDVPLETHKAADEILRNYYGEAEYSPARQRMAKTPRGAVLIPNIVSSAPGFIIGNVHVMAGVPSIMQAMIDHVVATLKGGPEILSRTVPCAFAESVIAQGLGTIQNQYPDIEIGSYPHFKDGVLGVNIVLRGLDEALMTRVEQEVIVLLMSLQK